MGWEALPKDFFKIFRIFLIMIRRDGGERAEERAAWVQGRNKKILEFEKKFLDELVLVRSYKFQSIGG